MYPEASKIFLRALCHREVEVKEVLALFCELTQQKETLNRAVPPSGPSKEHNQKKGEPRNSRVLI